MWDQSSFAQYSQHYLTRGADTAEIYFSHLWYGDSNNKVWRGIFRSTDNGQTLSVQRKTFWLDEGGLIYGDSTSGVLYQIPFRSVDTFAVSFDYGKTFEPRFFNGITFQTAGCMAGELYISGYGLYRGTDFGNTFTLQSYYDSLRLQDVGISPGELYMIKNVVGLNPMKLAYSNDYGQTFTIREVSLPGMPPILDDITIHHGTLPGEFYAVVWNWIDTIALYHTYNYGQTMTLQSYMLQTIDEVFYTAGRAPGTFYYARTENCGNMPMHTCLWIYFSHDYGVTFTTYFHDLDSVYTHINDKQIPPELIVFPNPVNQQLHFRFDNILLDCDVNISLFNLPGKQVADCILRKGQREVCIDTRNLSAGFYFYRLLYPNFKASVNKINFSKSVFGGKVQIVK